MVRIVDGNIVEDNQVGGASNAAAQPRAQAAAAGHAPVFDWSAAPVSVAHEPPEDCIAGFAGVDIYGARFAARHLLALAGVTAFFGVRGFVVGTVAWAVYKYNQGAAQRPPPGQRPRAAAPAGTTSLGQILSGPPAGRREYIPGSGLPSGAGQSSSAAPTAGSWSGRGRGQKLGS